MNIFILVWKYLREKSLNTILNMTLLALGIAVVTVLALFNRQLQEKISDNAKGIDLVVGAKGSPLQLILCNIFHIDFPTGNISLREAERIAKHRLVKEAIPLALGDSYAGFRIIGTTQAYPEVYEASLASGQLWSRELEVTLGSDVANALALKVGDRFASTHGLTQDGHDHDAQQFVVVGIFQPTQSVLDNLICTSVESVWLVHAAHSDEASHKPDSSSSRSPLIESIAAGDSTKEITSLLVQYRSPMGAIQMPRWVNSQSSMQAASPAFETARLFSILGVGVDLLNGFAMILIFISGLSIFIALYNSLQERKFDLAIMRSMGASRSKLLTSILLEGLVLTAGGCLLGFTLAHGTLEMMGMWVEETRKAGITGFVFYNEEWIILVGSLLLGILCSIIPAVQAYRTDISTVLSGNR